MDPYSVVVAAEMYPANQTTKIVKTHKFQHLKATSDFDITFDRIKTKNFPLLPILALSDNTKVV